MYPTDEITKQLIEQRIAQFEAESAADYADAMELVSELEAAEAEQARLAAADARIRELENKVAAEENDLLQQDADAATARDLGILDMAAADLRSGCSLRFVASDGVDEYGCPLGELVADDE